jgi:hypothetical protein
VKAVLKNRFLDASAIAHDKDLNPNEACRKTVQNLLNNEGLFAFIPLKLLVLSEDAA